MKNSRKKTFITVGIITIIFLLTIIGYISYRHNKIITSFSSYVAEYKQVTNTYIFTDKKDIYENLIKESEQAIADKNSKGVIELEIKLNQLKEDMFQTNLELINTNIIELENIDISNFEDKELIKENINEIKNLSAEGKFVTANELSLTLMHTINEELKTIKIEEEKKKSEEESKKKKEESINNIVGKYQLIDENINGFVNKSIYLEITKNEQAKILLSGSSHVLGGSGCIIPDHQGDIHPMDHMRCVNYFSNSIQGEIEIVDDNIWNGFIVNSNKDATKHPIKIIFKNNELLLNMDDSGMPAGSNILLKVTDFEDIWDRLKPLYN